MNRVKRIILLLLVFQGVLMAQMVKEIKIKDVSVPVIFEEGKYIPIVSMQFVFKNAGHLSNTKDGLADMSAKLLNEGTAKDGSTVFATKLDEHAVEVGAHVGRESFVIEVSALKSEFAYAIERLKELLKDPNYKEDTVEHVKHQKIGWITQKKSDFDYIAATKLREILFKGTALAKPYNGTLESVEKINLNDIKTFINTSLGYNNVIAVVGGDISFDEVEKYLKDVIELLPKVDIKSVEKIEASSKKETILIDEETQQAYIYFASPFNYSYEAKDQYKAKIAEYLLGGGGFGSRLMEEIRVKRGLTYGVYSALKRTKSVSYMSGYLQTKLSTQDEAKDLIQKVVDNFVKSGIAEEELKSAKEFLIGSEPLRTETLSQRLGRAYSDYYYGRPLDFSKEQLKQIENVTLTDMNKFITTHKELSDISFSIVTKK